MEKSDSQLLDEYCRGAQSAFTELGQRHAELVYATAMRRTGDPGMADDVTQAVFVILEKKARGLRTRATLAGWLIVVTRHVARAALRARLRRQRHERAAARGEAANMKADEQSHTAELSRVLDDALANLNTGDRDAVALRYLEANSFVDVGKILGISEEAARKRVDRGIDRLRRLLAGRSIFLEAAALSNTLTKLAAVPVPARLIESLARHRSGQVSRATISISNEVLRMFLFRKIGVGMAIALLLTGIIAGISVRGQSNVPTLVAASAPPAAEPALVIPHMVIQLGVRNLQKNIDFFERVGFHLAAEDANRPIQWATVESGVVRFRLIYSGNRPIAGSNLMPYFWIDGGLKALSALHDDIASRDVEVGEIDMGGTPRPAVEMRGGHLQSPPAKNPLISFDVRTPDGYVMGFMTMRDWPPR